jgi:sulfite exporter TauE/SafE
MSLAVDLFLTGVTLGFSSCSLFCIPILIPYIAGTTEGWRASVKATCIFSLSRLSAYVLLGLLAGASGDFLLRAIGGTAFGFYVWVLSGVFVAILGVFMVLGRELQAPLCRTFVKHTIEDSVKSMAFLGFIVGVTPCAPLFGILTYVAATVQDAALGAFYTFCFGVGAAIVTPITRPGSTRGLKNPAESS